MTFAGLLAAIFATAPQYALVALGWVIPYKATGILSFASGAFFLIFTLVYASLSDSTWLGAGSWLAVILTLIIGAVASALVYGLLLRRLFGRDLFSIVVLTMGLSILVTGLTNIFWGTDIRSVPVPIQPTVIWKMANGSVVTNLEVIGLITALVVSAVFFALVKYSRGGVYMRAVAEKPLLSLQGGIPMYGVAAASWAASGLCLAAGAVLFVMENKIASPQTGDIGLIGLAPALLGGMDSILGTVIGAVLMSAIVYVGAQIFHGAEYATAFAVVLVLLLIRPQGLFGSTVLRRA